MDEINIRFKELREICGKTQDEWGAILGIQRSGICDIENGRRKVTANHKKHLSEWEEQLINIEWLETGKGKPFRDVSKSEQITMFVGSFLKAPDDSFKKRLVSILAQLDSSDWEALEEIAKKIINKPE